ncbi:MAG TPA: tyrosinase family protein [Acidobacteriaceae bacterium]|nr:tyrosinase family protein [Acidobacteriaceae bacterium]
MAPSGGTPFSPGSDKRPVVLRKSISALTASELTQLGTAYAKLRALPSTDKRTWVLQADIHALLCDQCNGVAMQIHGSWNFFPWHRAYLYFYERILGSLVNNLNYFRLPYWDWENHRSMPGSYLTPANSGNSLWDKNRDPGIAGGGALPTSDGTTARLNTLFGLTDFATFGGSASSAGACENDPHNLIHSDVGPAPYPYEDMGNLGYAARDPIFFGHHCNIDKIWAEWNGQTGSHPGDYKNPTDAAFLNAKWSFYDENQNVVSISAANVLDYSGNLRYTYTVPRFRIPIFEIYECKLLCCLPDPDPGAFLQVSEQATQTLMERFRANSSITLVLSGVPVPEGVTGVFDVVVARGARRTHVGTLTVLADNMKDMQRKPVTLALDISKAVPDLLAKQQPAAIQLVARHKTDARAKPFMLRAQRAQIRVERQR